jgi:hypothetical protein
MKRLFFTAGRCPEEDQAGRRFIQISAHARANATLSFYASIGCRTAAETLLVASVGFGVAVVSEPLQKTPAKDEANRAVRIHYTPTYSSSLNQVETWFSKIQRDVIS